MGCARRWRGEHPRPGTRRRRIAVGRFMMFVLVAAAGTAVSPGRASEAPAKTKVVAPTPPTPPTATVPTAPAPTAPGVPVPVVPPPQPGGAPPAKVVEETAPPAEPVVA